jgi:hypothetical protein
VAVVAWCIASACANAGANPPTGTPPDPSKFDPDCLLVEQSSAATYVIRNASCANESVLASIELAGDGGSVRCFTKKIRSQISIASEHAAPLVNYQCIEGIQGCSIEELRGMFPECHPG